MWTDWCARWKNTQNVDIFEETDFLRFSQKSHFPKTVQILKIVQSVNLRPKHASFGRWPLDHALQKKFCPFCNWKFPPISHTSGLNATFWNFNNTVLMKEKIFPKMFPSSLICGSKCQKVCCNQTRKEVYREEQKAPLPAMGKVQRISSCN